MNELFWDATYAISMALMEEYPSIDIEAVGLKQLTRMVLALPTFNDDPRLVTNQILLDIQTIWYEEATTL